METFLMIVIGLVAVAAVAYPLLRRGSGMDPHLDPDPSMIEATDARSAGAVGPPELEREITQYREALRAGTLCPKCSFANSATSRFCAECGTELKPADGAADGSAEAALPRS
ncbi:MAG TPA: zinc ribbon domain-containing protein [Longimicrobiales bacterium]|nr:zinc ribbon domain-containing protein [Longimicrobiales bacterium]